MPGTMNEVAQATPEVKPVEPVIETKVETPKEDLVTRASKVKVEPKTEKAPDNPFGLTKEDYDKVQSDPTLSKFYKSMQSDYGRKTQEIASLRKDYEQKLVDSGKWSPEKVRQLMDDQNFVSAASQVLQKQPPADWNGTQQEWSALNEREKQDLAQLKQGYQSMAMQLAMEQQRKQDESLKTKFANYEPQAVDVITNELLQGKRNATREDIWKVYDYENATRRAYELGKQDALQEKSEKSNATSYDGMQVNPPNRTEAPKKDEANSSAFRRIMLENIAKFKGRNQ